MAHNKLYRNFIILQEDERGYSHSNDKALSGYAKVEAKGDKCKISFYAQNLRQEDNYSMVLICCKRDLKQLIDLGPFAINEVGKGDTSKEYYVNNIAGLGISYEKISGAAIYKVKDNETEFIMHGFMNGEDSTDNWRKFKMVKVDSKKYINKFESEPKKNDIHSSSIADKAIISQSNIVETEIVKTSNLEIGLAERKKDENNIESKENIELKALNQDNSQLEDKEKNRILENDKNIDESIGILDEDRNKCKEIKKCDKHEMFEEIEEFKKCDNHEMIGKMEEAKKCDKHEMFGEMEETKKCDKHEMFGEMEKTKKYDKHEMFGEMEKTKKCDKHEMFGEMEKTKKCDKHEMFGEIEKTKKCDKHEMFGEMEKTKKCDKHEMFGKMEETKKCDKCEISESIEESIKKISKKIGTYDGVIDLRINNLHEDIIVYGFIRDKKNDDCKWKKFKLEKKCRNESQGFNDFQSNSRRMEENFKLDKLNEVDKEDRLDKLDFDEYESDIQKVDLNETMQKLSLSNAMQEATPNNTIQEATSNNIIQQKISNNAVKKTTSNNNFNMCGEVGKYFEKLAEGFEPYNGSLADINYCKLYKINVNSMEDLCDESNYNQYTLAYYPMLNYYPYINKDRYFLLGYKCNGNGEMKYIVYAIPGSKEKSDQPYGGRTGFVTWTSDNKNDIGYWLMFYDFKNSTIVIPTK